MHIIQALSHTHTYKSVSRTHCKLSKFNPNCSHSSNHSLTHPTEIVENWQCAGIAKAGWGIEQGWAAFPSFQMLFTAWNEWLWEACRISVEETNLAGWGRTDPWGPSFDTISTSTLRTFRPWPSPIPMDSPLLLPSPTHTVGPEGRNTHCSHDFVRSFLGCVKTKILNFYRETWLFLKNKQTNKPHLMIKYEKSKRRTIYCWQFIRLHPSGGQGRLSSLAVLGEQFRPLRATSRPASELCPDCWGRSSGCGLFMFPFKTNPTKEQSSSSAGNVSSPDIWHCQVLSAEEWASRLCEGAACSHLLGASSFHSELNSNCETGQ